jgi:hypothetical protein
MEMRILTESLQKNILGIIADGKLHIINNHKRSADVIWINRYFNKNIYGIPARNFYITELRAANAININAILGSFQLQELYIADFNRRFAVVIYFKRLSGLAECGEYRIESKRILAEIQGAVTELIFQAAAEKQHQHRQAYNQ